MEPALKQRLVGASVLVALGVVVIPMLLDSGSAPPTDPIQIPPRPADLHTAPVLDAPAAEVPVAEAGPPDSVPIAEPSAGAAERIPTPPEDGSATPEAKRRPSPVTKPPAARSERPAASAPTPERLGVRAYAIQLASFSSEASAKALESKLKGRGYRAFVERIYLNSGSVFRVRVGPEIEAAKAKALLARLETDISLKGILVRYP